MDLKAKCAALRAEQLALTAKKQALRAEIYTAFAPHLVPLDPEKIWFGICRAKEEGYAAFWYAQELRTHSYMPWLTFPSHKAATTFFCTFEDELEILAAESVLGFSRPPFK